MSHRVGPVQKHGFRRTHTHTLTCTHIPLERPPPPLPNLFVPSYFPFPPTSPSLVGAEWAPKAKTMTRLLGECSNNCGRCLKILATQYNTIHPILSRPIHVKPANLFVLLITVPSYEAPTGRQQHRWQIQEMMLWFSQSFFNHYRPNFGPNIKLMHTLSHTWTNPLMSCVMVFKLAHTIPLFLCLSMFYLQKYKNTKHELMNSDVIFVFFFPQKNKVPVL